MTKTITGSMLYDLVQCPHRVSMDLFGEASRRDPVSPFVELLWEKGYAFEHDVMSKLELPFTDIRRRPKDMREELTLEAMTAGHDLIYGGRIASGHLVGEPDLLRKSGAGYVAGDIKSGAGVEGGSEDEDGKPKTHYAVQLALYTDILDRIGLAAGRTAFVWDVHGEEVIYNLDEPRGPKAKITLWGLYLSCLETALAITSQTSETSPALQAACKLCHWRTYCSEMLVRMDDLTLIPELGRSRRDVLADYFRKVSELAEAELGPRFGAAESLPRGISMKMLERFQARARLQKQPGAKPYLREPIAFQDPEVELFFDVETDPMRDTCYLHGFTERRRGHERYVSFFADRPDAELEEDAFKGAWEFIQSSMPCALYYYSHYERSILKKLARKYPAVASEEDVIRLFDSDEAIDLYSDIVRPKTEWPTRDLSIKTLASHLGFRWRDTEPSGAASIEWYHEWVKTGDQKYKTRILEYNHDDCVATRVLLDALREFEVKPDS